MHVREINPGAPVDVNEEIGMTVGAYEDASKLLVFTIRILGFAVPGRKVPTNHQCVRSGSNIPKTEYRTCFQHP
jgi:hypothetical protein